MLPTLYCRTLARCLLARFQPLATVSSLFPVLKHQLHCPCDASKANNHFDRHCTAIHPDMMHTVAQSMLPSSLSSRRCS